ncbi:MAG: hypothetical protein OEV43_00800 [Coriobacteriia bacterium]|nr:hypothetical protein [Coriobacteriia bacterium]
MEGIFAICGIGPLCLYAFGALIVLGVFIKVLLDRVNNKEDSYYEKNVRQ